MSTEFTVAPIGLMTQPSKIGVMPQGAMERADGLCMRSPAKLTPFRVPSQLLAPPATGTFTTCIGVFPTKQLLFVAASTSGQAVSTNFYWGNQGSAVMTAITTIESQQFNRARCRPFTFRDRLFLPLRSGLAVLDSIDGSDTTVRWAGLPQPIVSFIFTPFPNAGNSVNLNAVVGYSAVLRRMYADGYELVSAPSPIQRFRNSDPSALPTQPSIRVDWGRSTIPARNGVIAGDFVDVYRTKEASAPTAGLRVDPGTTLYKVATYVVTANDAANGYVTTSVGGLPGIPDTASANQVVGDELYANPGQETLQSARFTPPIAKCCDVFKGYTFFANTLEPGAWTTSFPGGYGNLSATGADRANGIGQRDFTGTLTNGNATITGISAADLVGIVPGQQLSDNPGVKIGSATVVSVGASSLVMSAPAAGSGVTVVHSYDVVELDGTIVFMWTEAGTFFGAGLGSAAGLGYQVTASEPIIYTEGPPSVSPNNRTYGQQFQLSPFRATQNSNGISVRGTNGKNHSPAIPEIGLTAKTFSQTSKPNFFQWSWEQQPESVSPATYAFVGSGEIYQLAVTRDVMWIFASDGLWRFTGYGTRPSGIQANWRVDQIDKTLVLAGPNAFAVLRDAVFAYTNIGLVKISDAGGVQPISRGVIGDLLPGRYWIEDNDISMAADEVLDEIWINVNSGNFEGGTGVSNCYVWSETYGVFTKLNQSTGPSDVLQQVAYDRVLPGMVFGVGRSASTGPRVDHHNPAVASFMAWTLDYQPQYGPDPGSSKQWTDMAAVFDPASAGKLITPRFNGIAYGANPLVQYPQQLDSRAFFGVSQNAPAVANALAPGVSGASETTPTELRMVAMAYEPLAEQQVFR